MKNFIKNYCIPFNTDKNPKKPEFKYIENCGLINLELRSYLEECDINPDVWRWHENKMMPFIKVNYWFVELNFSLN